MGNDLFALASPSAVASKPVAAARRPGPCCCCSRRRQPADPPPLNLLPPPAAAAPCCSTLLVLTLHPATARPPHGCSGSEAFSVRWMLQRQPTGKIRIQFSLP
ncbi:hypothetical protein PVAP13_3NG177506 [Panicum virgatum]|uniref:Uncharacterized protein n=1 Tax=Panicum virgatum TaxID=38727 RepID=A0A8T0U7D4_PANVG|nr:hypothetical protein PVAP13_3NG177506 [Panicum virgatum]